MPQNKSLDIRLINIAEITEVHNSIKEPYSKLASCEFSSNQPEMTIENLQLFSKLHPLHILPKRTSTEYKIFAGMRLYEIALGHCLNEGESNIQPIFLWAVVYSSHMKSEDIVSTFELDTLATPLVYSLGVKPRQQLISLRKQFGARKCSRISQRFDKLHKGL